MISREQITEIILKKLYTTHKEHIQNVKEY